MEDEPNDDRERDDPFEDIFDELEFMETEPGEYPDEET